MSEDPIRRQDLPALHEAPGFERIADHGLFAQHATFAVTSERLEVGS
jgi:hypothetical protein